MTAKNPDDHAYAVIMKVRNQPGVLVRVAQVFARRGHNIESLHVERDINNQSHSNMAIGAYGKKEKLEQIIAQIRKLIDVVDISIREEDS